MEKGLENYRISHMEWQTDEAEREMELREIRLATACVSAPREADFL